MMECFSEEVADAVAASESVGNRICGLYYLESYCEQLLSGRVNGQASPDVQLARSGSVFVDADDGFAQPAFSKGLPEVLNENMFGPSPKALSALKKYSSEQWMYGDPTSFNT